MLLAILGDPKLSGRREELGSRVVGCLRMKISQYQHCLMTCTDVEGDYFEHSIYTVAHKKLPLELFAVSLPNLRQCKSKLQQSFFSLYLSWRCHNFLTMQ